MNFKTIIFLLLLGFINLSYGQTSQENDSNKPTITFLGSFHFAGSSTDAGSLKVDDIKTDKRQREIENLVESLARFKPTKVILEYPYGNKKLDSLYQLYLNDQKTLSINESQQVGFRLAKLLKHDHVYPADHKMDLPFEDIMAYLEERGEMNKFQDMMGNIMKAMATLQEVYSANSITESLAYMNQDQFDQMNKNLYLEYINKMGSAENAVGSNVVAISALLLAPVTVLYVSITCCN